MNTAISEIKKAILQEILWIRQGKAKLPSVQSARKELLEAEQAHVHLASFGPDVPDSLLEDAGRAMSERDSENAEWLEELNPWKKYERQQRIDKVTIAVENAFRLALAKQFRASTRLQIARLAKNGLSINEIEQGIWHPKKIIPNRNTRLRFVKGRWVTGTTKNRRRR